jgi:murein DD-endopeptidase MepM/ murein hydrolase activator NlpD
MNYSQKRTLIGRIVYIGLTAMAVVVLCVTVYTFIGSGKTQNHVKLPQTSEPEETPSATQKPNTDLVPPVTKPPVTGDKPTVVPPVKDWTQVTLTMPVEGTVMKAHDPVNAVYSATMNDYRVHRGIDIECNVGDEVLCVAYGTVISVGADPFMGTTVTVDHGDGLITVYKNLSPELPEGIKTGAEVFEGDVIGAVGESAIIEIADEPHLHLEMTLNGEAVDPLDFFDYKPTVAPEDNENTGK